MGVVAPWLKPVEFRVQADVCVFAHVPQRGLGVQGVRAALVGRTARP